MKFLAMGSACKRYNDTTYSRIIWTAAVTHSDQISWNVCISFSLAWRWCAHPGCRIKSPIIILDIRNVIQRVVVYMQIIFSLDKVFLDWRSDFLVLQYKRNANVQIEKPTWTLIQMTNTCLSTQHDSPKGVKIASIWNISYKFIATDWLELCILDKSGQ